MTDDPEPLTPSRRSRQGSSAARLAEVAARAGVSTATVSRVFNQPDRVSPPLRERVRAVATELGWIPNAAGRALASRRTHIVGAIIPTLDDEVFAARVAGLQQRLRDEGLTLLLGCFDYDPALALQEVQAMLARGVEALALVGEEHPPALFAALQRQRVPYVVTYAWHADSPHPCVGFDNAAAFVGLVEHLLELGHRRFAVIHQPLAGNDHAVARLAGIRSALAAAGLTLPEAAVREGPPTMAFGGASALELLAATPRPTVLVCGNDRLALGALFALRERGIAVPEQVSITGFDDLELAAQVSPALTTLHVDNRALGVAAAEALLAALAGEPPRSLALPVTLRRRGTTARAPT